MGGNNIVVIVKINFNIRSWKEASSHLCFKVEKQMVQHLLLRATTLTLCAQDMYVVWPYRLTRDLKIY